MADIFVSYTSSDKDWAEWIGHALIGLGHAAHLHDWEIEGGASFMQWMIERHDKADIFLGVVSDAWIRAAYSAVEREAAEAAAVKDRPNFIRYVMVRPVKMPTFGDHRKRVEFFGAGVTDAERLRRLKTYIETPQASPARASPDPGVAVSNISIRVPEHFFGRENELQDIEKALARYAGRVAITALHGLRGVGKTVLAAAFAERQRKNYRATWWIRAETADAMRADLVGLGVRLGWVAPDEKEAPALAKVMERLRHEGEGILLIYDNAVEAKALRPFLPQGGAAKILVTSNAHAWRGVAEPVEIRLWPKEIGADFLLARTGRTGERAEAEALSEALGGLPLAHEQAGAYCERLDLSLGDYLKRFEAAPVRFLDAEKDAPADYHDKLTAMKTFALAIGEAAKLHDGAEPLIVHAALLAPEPIPLFLLEEIWGRLPSTQPPPSWPGLSRPSTPGRCADASEGSGTAPLPLEPSPSPVGVDGRDKPGHDSGEDAGHDDGGEAREQLEEALAALRGFALIEREEVADERDPAEKTACVRLHRLVRIAADARRQGAASEDARRTLIEAMRAVYPLGVFDDPDTWPRARRLDALALALVADAPPPQGAEGGASWLLDRLASYRQSALGAFAAAQPLFEKALALAEAHFGPEHTETSIGLSNLAVVLQDLGGADNLALAQNHLTRALAIDEAALGPLHPSVAIRLSNLALVLQGLGGADNLALAQNHLTRALAIDEAARGPQHPYVALRLSNLARVLEDIGGAENLALARENFVRAEKILRSALGDDHPYTHKAAAHLARFRAAHGEG
jgi:hypothetical protein